MEKFKSGATVYSADGQAAQYVAAIAEGHIVRPVVEAYSGDGESSYEHICDPVTWRVVFSVPPVAKYNDELKAIHEKIAAAEKALADKRAEDGRYMAAARERAIEREKVEQLRNLDNFLAGKITHYIKQEYYGPPTIVDAQKDTQEDRGRELRVLTLQGVVGKPLQWYVNRYADGSGSMHTVQPCCGLDEAIVFLKTAIAKHFAAKPTDGRSDWVESADQHGVPVPPAYRMKVLQNESEQITATIERTRREASSYAAKLSAEESRLAEITAQLSDGVTQ